MNPPGTAGILHRDHTKEIRHKDVAKTLAGMCIYFWMHSIPNGVIHRLLRAGQELLSDNRGPWIDSLNSQSRQYQKYVLTTIIMALESLSAMYGFEFLTTLSDTEFRQLITDIFDLDPLAHAMAMWAKHHSGVDIIGIYRDVSIAEEQTKRGAFRASIKYRFVNCCMVTWKYRMNIDPKVASIAENQAFEIWRDMAIVDDAHLNIVTLLKSPESVPVHDTVTRFSGKNKSFFALMLARKDNDASDEESDDDDEDEEGWETL